MLQELVSKYVKEIKAIVVLTLALGIYIFVRDYLDMKNKLAVTQAENSTLSSEFKKFGDAYTTQNQILKDKQAANDAAIQLLGNNVVSYMKDQNARITSLYSAIGEVQSSVVDIKRIVGGTRDDKGLVKDVYIPQDRDGKAPLTGVSLNYDPSKPLGTAFQGSKWKNNKEVFEIGLGEWQLKDGGYRAAFKLERQVIGPDGKPAGPKEPIDLSGAEGRFTEDKFRANGSTVPRFTLTPIGGYDQIDKRWKPGLMMDYRLGNSIGVSGGQVGPMTVLGLSWRFDIHK